MKRFLVYLILVLIFCQCSKNNANDEKEKQLNVSEFSDAFGRSVASDIHEIALSLHKAGVDYSDADASEEFKCRYYEDLSKICKPITKGTNLFLENGISVSEFVVAYRTLTKKQLHYVNRIIDDTANSVSYSDMMNRLVQIADDISRDVPEIQQERLQNIVAVLYYGAKEMQYLDDNGLMVNTPVRVNRLKTRSETTDGATCRVLLETIWTIAVGEPTPTGEIVASIATVLIGAVWYYEVVVCKDSYAENRDWCIKLYEKCKEQNPPILYCYDCLEYCRVQGVWPDYNCPIIY